MKRRVKVDVVTEDLSGPRRVVERGTITLNGRQYRKIKGDQWKREQANKEFTEQPAPGGSLSDMGRGDGGDP